MGVSQNRLYINSCSPGRYCVQWQLPLCMDKKLSSHSRVRRFLLHCIFRSKNPHSIVGPQYFCFVYCSTFVVVCCRIICCCKFLLKTLSVLRVSLAILQWMLSYRLSNRRTFIMCSTAMHRFFGICVALHGLFFFNLSRIQKFC